jgi:hypothetical protein
MIALTTAGALIAAASCGNNGNSSNGSCALAISFLGGGNMTSLCSSCQQSKCSSQVGGLTSGCSAAASCICSLIPDAATTTLPMCMQAADTMSCTSAIGAIRSCVASNCASECAVSGSSSGGISNEAGGD